MPRYVSTVKRWLSHECRMVEPDVEFETTFPKVKDAKGKLVSMRLGETLKEVSGKEDDKPDDSETDDKIV